MPIESITVTRLADHRFGDRVKSCDERPYSPVRVVKYELAPIEVGSAVRGVRWKTLTPPARRARLVSVADGWARLEG